MPIFRFRFRAMLMLFGISSSSSASTSATIETPTPVAIDSTPLSSEHSQSLSKPLKYLSKKALIEARNKRSVPEIREEDLEETFVRGAIIPTPSFYTYQVSDASGLYFYVIRQWTRRPSHQQDS